MKIVNMRMEQAGEGSGYSPMYVADVLDDDSELVGTVVFPTFRTIEEAEAACVLEGLEMTEYKRRTMGYPVFVPEESVCLPTPAVDVLRTLMCRAHEVVRNFDALCSDGSEITVH